jgi:DNA-binding MarR family transcriptional regulator
MPTSTHASAPGAPAESAPDLAERLRFAVTRLARLFRQQDEGGFGSTFNAALASVKNRGPLTLGELAAAEQVAPPTMTKVVEKLEANGFVTRQIDPTDRRVTRVSVTPDGLRHLDSTRQRRTAWLATRLEQLDEQQLERLLHSLDVLEALTDIETPR